MLQSFQPSVPFRSELHWAPTFTSHLLYLASLTLVQTSKDNEDEKCLNTINIYF